MSRPPPICNDDVVICHAFYLMIIKRERARRASEQRGIHMQRRGFRCIFSKVSGPIRSGHVGKSSVGLRERQVCKIILIAQEIRKLR